MRDTITYIHDALLALERSPDPVLDLRTPEGTVVAWLVKPELMAKLAPELAEVSRPKKPKELPRAMRPKQKLSKRQRDLAKREKLGAAVVS